MFQSTRRLWLPVAVAAIFIASCSSSSKTPMAQRNAVKGTWVLDNIGYEGLLAGEKLRISLLDEGTEDCLKGSAWVLPHNGYGSYTITSSQGGCTAGQTAIIWSYRTENGQAIVQYKRLKSGVKAKKIEEGYRFRLVNASANSMKWQSEFTYQGHPIYINYNFSKK